MTPDEVKSEQVKQILLGKELCTWGQTQFSTYHASWSGRVFKFDNGELVFPCNQHVSFFVESHIEEVLMTQLSKEKEENGRN